MRYFFEIAYHGKNYHGWQRQDNAVTVQQVVEEALSTILRKPITLTGSGRTDTGVHCMQQYFHIDYDGKLPDDLIYRLNNYLPADISIQSVREVRSEAHARFSAIDRQYEYIIIQHKNPFMQNSAYYLSKPLNLKTMNEAATLLIGKHDFESFSRVKTEVNNFICEITHASWQQTEKEIIFTIRANRFLRGMVRAIVGTLIQVGLGKINREEFREIIAAKDRKRAGSAAPAHALFLYEVTYPSDIFID